ncbi:hypothetical protein [Nocardia jejuensis]|uniref:hypothetical protein n=1 Tax=Nocardia jejuensis TaxID=328049 RepID=UPI00082F1605|nr:hypothetical protein [Nocardia jejuensis]
MSFWGGMFGSKQGNFGERALTMVLAQDSVAGAEFDAKAFEIAYVKRDGERGRINLTTVFRRCEDATPEAAERMLTDFVRMNKWEGGPEEPTGWAAAAPLVRPLIRQAGDLDMRVEGMRIADHTLWRPVAPCLSETVVLDQPTSMQRVTPHDLEQWGIDAETVFSTARANLAELALDTIGAYDPGASNGMVYIGDNSGDLYAGSLPLVDGWLAGVGAKAGARPIAFVAQNVGVLFGVEFSEAHVERLVSLAGELFDNGIRQVSPMPYTVDEQGTLVPYQVHRNHVAWKDIRAAESRLSAAVYGQQYDYLRADLDEGRTEDRAAKLMHARKPDGTETTIAPWTDGVPTLLPRVHTVTLTDPETGETFGVPWETLAAEVDLPPAAGIYPPRYRVEFHPDENVMARLRAAQRMD